MEQPEYVKTIDDLGRILIPKAVREAMGWEKGTQIAVYVCENGNGVLLRVCGDEDENEV